MNLGLKGASCSAKDDGGALVPGAHAPLMPVLTRSLKEGMREIRATMRQKQRQQKEQREKEEAALSEWQQKFLEESPSLFPAVPADACCSSAAAGTGQLHAYLRWFPPCAQFAKACSLEKICSLIP